MIEQNYIEEIWEELGQEAELQEQLYLLQLEENIWQGMEAWLSA